MLRKPLITLGLLAFALSRPASAAMPPRLEPTFSEAVLAYHQKNYSGALQALGPGLALTPPPTEFLELQALIYRALKRDDAAAAVYRRLLGIVTPDGKPAAAAAPYDFELGLIGLRQKRYNSAKRYLSASAQLGFNRAAAYFFLGVIAFQEQSWEVAESSFRAAIKQKAPEVTPAAHVYLAQLAGRADDPPRMVGHFIAARRLAKRELASAGEPDDLQEQARQVMKSVDSFLGSVARPRWFGGVGLISMYDSNVLSMPASSFASPTGATGASSVGEIVKVNLGYATSPVADVQVVPSYRGSLVYQGDPDAKAGQFIINDFSTYLNVLPLGLTSGGLKLEGLWIFQYSPSTDGSGGGQFQPYSLAASFAPYLRQELVGRWTLTAELAVQPEKYYSDPNVDPSLQRSGWEQSFRIGVKQNRRYGLWNPGASLTEDVAITDGTEYRSKALGIGVDDTLYLFRRTTLLLALAIGAAAFDSREGPSRLDGIAIARAAIAQELSQSFVLNGEIQYIGNDSNISQYGFTRFLLTAGISYVF